MTIELTTLPNGLTVATNAMPGYGTAAVAVTFGAGSRFEAPKEQGIAHMLEHMAFKGTNRRSALCISEEIEQVGGDLNAYTSAEDTLYEARVHGDDIPLAMDVLSDILTDPLLSEADIEREKEVILAEIGARRDSPDDFVYELAMQQSFAGQAFGRSTGGTPETVMALSHDMLADFRARHYHAGNAIVVASGNVNHADLVRLAEDKLGRLAAGRRSSAPKAEWTGGVVCSEQDIEQTYLMMMFPGASEGSSDLMSMRIFAAIVGGGMSSRLFTEIREKRGLAYSLQGFHFSFSDTGVLGFGADAADSKFCDLLPAILDVLSAAPATLSERELARAKAQLRMSIQVSRESPGQSTHWLTNQILAHGRPILPSELLLELDAVTLEDVRRVGQAALAATPTLATVGPNAALPPVDSVRRRLDQLAA